MFEKIIINLEKSADEIEQIRNALENQLTNLDKKIPINSKFVGRMSKLQTADRVSKTEDNKSHDCSEVEKQVTEIITRVFE